MGYSQLGWRTNAKTRTWRSRADGRWENCQNECPLQNELQEKINLPWGKGGSCGVHNNDDNDDDDDNDNDNDDDGMATQTTAPPKGPVRQKKKQNETEHCRKSNKSNPEETPSFRVSFFGLVM